MTNDRYIPGKRLWVRLRGGRSARSRPATHRTSGLGVVWDATARKATLLKEHANRVSSIHFDRSGARAITASWDGTARIWDVATGHEIARLVQYGSYHKARGGGPQPDSRSSASKPTPIRRRRWQAALAIRQGHSKNAGCNEGGWRWRDPRGSSSRGHCS